MTNRHRSFIPIASLFLALPAAADTRIEYVDESSGAIRSVITLSEGRARMDDASDATYTLFDTDTGVLTLVDPQAKTFTVMDRAKMEEFSEEVGSAMAELRAQLESMPPEQRAMMEKMMGGAADAGKAMLQTEIRHTGKSATQGGHDCEIVTFAVGGIARTQLCVADEDDIDMPDGDRATLNAMYAGMQAMADSMMSAFGAEPTPDMKKLGGMPVYVKQDNEASGMVLKDVSHGRVDAGLFAIPEGYREEALDIGE